MKRCFVVVYTPKACAMQFHITKLSQSLMIQLWLLCRQTFPSSYYLLINEVSLSALTASISPLKNCSHILLSIIVASSVSGIYDCSENCQTCLIILLRSIFQDRNWGYLLTLFACHVGWMKI
jgi:hypothetical protein